MKSAESNLVELNSADHHLSVSIISIKLCWSKVNWTYSKKQTCDNHSAEGAKTNIMWQNNITTCITILYHLILWMYLILPKWCVVNLSIVVFYIDPGAIIHLWWSCLLHNVHGTYNVLYNVFCRAVSIPHIIIFILCELHLRIKHCTLHSINCSFVNFAEVVYYVVCITYFKFSSSCNIVTCMCIPYFTFCLSRKICRCLHILQILLFRSARPNAYVTFLHVYIPPHLNDTAIECVAASLKV